MSDEGTSRAVELNRRAFLELPGFSSVMTSSQVALAMRDGRENGRENGENGREIENRKIEIRIEFENWKLEIDNMK